MKAVKRGADLLMKDPVTAWRKYCDVKPIMKNHLNGLQFERSFNYMSTDLANVERDWKKVRGSLLKCCTARVNLSVPQVTAYSKRLGIVSETFKPNMTNEFLSWPLQNQEQVDADAKQ
jgi:pyrimidine precursor biosynthesis enzyme